MSLVEASGGMIFGEGRKQWQDHAVSEEDDEHRQSENSRRGPKKPTQEADSEEED